MLKSKILTYLGAAMNPNLLVKGLYETTEVQPIKSDNTQEFYKEHPVIQENLQKCDLTEAVTFYGHELDAVIESLNHHFHFLNEKLCQQLGDIDRKNTEFQKQMVSQILNKLT